MKRSAWARSSIGGSRSCRRRGCAWVSARWCRGNSGEDVVGVVGGVVGGRRAFGRGGRGADIDRAVGELQVLDVDHYVGPVRRMQAVVVDRPGVRIDFGQRVLRASAVEMSYVDAT